MNDPVPSRFVTLATAIVSLTCAASAFAATPEDAELVEQVTVEIRSHDADEDGTALVGETECQRMLDNGAAVTVTWTLVPRADISTVEGVFAFSVERGFGGTTNCQDTGACTVLDVDDLTANANVISLIIDFDELLATADATTCENVDAEFFVRLRVHEAIGVTDRFDNSDAKIIVDTVRPSAPSGLTATASENSIKVEFDGISDGDLDRYLVYYSTTAFDGGQSPGGLDLRRGGIGTSTSGRIDVDLDGADRVFIAVAAEDETGNVSDLSGVVEASVTQTDDFWEAYRAAGGSERGGCSTTNGPRSLWPALLLLGFVFGCRRRRRRRSTIAAIILAIGLLAPTMAAAETPTMGAFELKLGSYYPAIDDEFDGTGPFETIFGTSNLLIGELEIDVWLWQRFGKLGLGGHIGFSKVKGTAIAADPTGDVDDETRFSIIPLRASVVYRFDRLAQETKIPLSASVKAGLDWYRWRIAQGNGDVATYQGDTGAGWTNGWHVSGALQFLLDIIDPGTAAAFDLNWGVNNSYFFLEYMLTRIDDFGGDGFDLSDQIWMLGLSFEY